MSWAWQPLLPGAAQLLAGGAPAPDLEASASQAFTIGQTAAADLVLRGSASQPFAIGQSATAFLVADREASADQAFVIGQSAAATGGTIDAGQARAADDRPARRKRRDRETLEAYYAALQRKANEDAEREKLEALAEAERALEEAESAKKAEAKRAAVRKVFAALDRAALTEKAKAGAREAEQAALQAIAKRQTDEQREAYLDALDQLNVEIEFIGAQIARLYARRREEEQFLLQRWFAA